MKLKRKILVGTAITLTVAGGAGAAFAYFTSGPTTGKGSATVSSDPPILVVEVPDIGGLAPDAAAQRVQYTITNKGISTTHLDKVTYAVVDKSGKCGKENFAFNGGTAGDLVVPVNQTLKPGQGVTWQLSVGMIDTGVPQDDCKSVVESLEVTAN
jgi:hypothetical protein